MFVRYGSNDRDHLKLSNALFGAPGEGLSRDYRKNHSAAFDWLSTLSPRLLFNVRVSFSQFLEGGDTVANSNLDLKSTLGLPQSLISQLFDPGYIGNHSLSGYMGLGAPAYLSTTNNYAIHPQVAYATGNHSIKAGLDMRLIQYAIYVQHVWAYSANAGFTQQNYLQADALSGNSAASLLIGGIGGGSTNYLLSPFYSQQYLAPYVQDDWRISRRLTLNLGFRLDYNLPPSERFNRMTRGFAAGAVNPVDALVNHAANPYLPQLKGGLLFAGVDGVSRRSTNVDKWNVQPRFGAAYQLTSKLVLRGGWGLYTSVRLNFFSS
jgi:hypothetical protein